MICCVAVDTSPGVMNGAGASIVPRIRFGIRTFVMRFRCVDAEIWADVRRALPAQVVGVTLGEEVLLSYCPWCGANLKEWIASHPEEFDALLSQVID
jgi:hypothetical protein